MRLQTVISASVVIALTAGASGHTASAPAIAAAHATPKPRVAACDGPAYRHAVYRHRHVRFRAQSRRWWSAMEIAPPETPDYYNPLLPSPYDTAYDRAMTLHFRSPAVSGSYFVELGWPPTPPVLGIVPYRVRDERAVYQYDGLIGAYVALARSDASRALAAVPLPR